MPTFDLRDSAPLDVRKYDVIGERRPAHVNHVAIALGDQAAVHTGAALHTMHMAPPLSDDQSVCAHVLGRLAVDATQGRDIQDWLDDQMASLAKISRRDQYHLSRVDAVDPLTGKIARRRYSCASFVQVCFKESLDVELVDQTALPRSSRATLERVWDEATVRLGRRFGLEGEGPWLVLLPAHILHALDRDDPRDSAYQAGPDDWDYPRPR